LSQEYEYPHKGDDDDDDDDNNNNNKNYNLLTAIGLSPGGSGYFTCTQNMKLVNNKFKSGGLHEKHVVAAWNLGNHLSIFF